MLDSVYLNCEAATSLDHNLAVLSDANSVRGYTLVTLQVDGAAVHLFPREARDLAASLIRAADLAEGV